jgi:hypothetical protein
MRSWPFGGNEALVSTRRDEKTYRIADASVEIVVVLHRLLPPLATATHRLDH